MRASQWFMPTIKETPHDAEIISHQLMLRAGLIRKLGSGLYTWLPMGLKILRRVENIIREELGRYGAVEILMPMVQPILSLNSHKPWFGMEFSVDGPISMKQMPCF